MPIFGVCLGQLYDVEQRHTYPRQTPWLWMKVIFCKEKVKKGFPKPWKGRVLFTFQTVQSKGVVYPERPFPASLEWLCVLGNSESTPIGGTYCTLVQ